MARVSRALVAASAELARRDPAMAAMVEQVGPCALPLRRSPAGHFASLARTICYQQLAGRAAATIHGRFVALFPDAAPSPAAVLALPDTALRGVGLSGSKVASLRDLAWHVESGEIRPATMARRADEEVVRTLTVVRGIGRWTAEMFLMFQLGRLDVWPVDDFGVRNGYARLYGLDPMPTARQLEPHGDAFRPYRSVAAWYCWRAVDTVTPG